MSLHTEPYTHAHTDGHSRDILYSRHTCLCTPSPGHTHTYTHTHTLERNMSAHLWSAYTDIPRDIKTDNLWPDLLLFVKINSLKFAANFCNALVFLKFVKKFVNFRIF